MMRVWWILAQISTILFETCLADMCRSLPCIIEPRRLRFWYHQMEIDASSLNVQQGDDVSISCDGSCVGTNHNPYLQWFGPNRKWIKSDLEAERIHVEDSMFHKYLQLHIHSMRKSDEGAYYCRGNLGNKIGWQIKAIILHLVLKEADANNISSGVEDSHNFGSSARPKGEQMQITSFSTRRMSDTTTTSLWQSTESLPTSNFTLTVSLSNSTFSTPTSTDSKLSETTRVKPESYTTETTPENVTVQHVPPAVTEMEPGCTWPHGFRCNNGQCIDSSYRCDNFPDCNSGEDELNCNAFSCSEGSIACEDNSACVASTEICDGIQQCRDGSDEFQYKCK